MFSFIHLLVGAAIGKLIAASWPVPSVVEWLLVAGLAFASHFLLDMLPHVDAGSLKPKEERGEINLADLYFALADLVLTGFVLWWLTTTQQFSVAVLAGAIGAIAPDFAHGWFYAFRSTKTIPPFAWYYRFHRGVQRTVEKAEWARGAVVEIAVAALALILYLF